MSGIPQQPYFLRALYEWCVDSGYTPYVTVRVDGHTRVPVAFVKDGQIVLNIGPNAVRNLQMDNEWLSFSARFGGVAQEIFVPMGNVMAIYARETGDGMAFPQTGMAPSAPEQQEAAQGRADAGNGESPGQDETPPEPSPPKGRPSLRLVK